MGSETVYGGSCGCFLEPKPRSRTTHVFRLLWQFARGVPALANLSLSGATPYLPQGQSSSSRSRGDGQKPSPTQSSVVGQ